MSVLCHAVSTKHVPARSRPVSLKQVSEWCNQVLTTSVAIQFNQQECEAVNRTAPDFVGCSPAGLSSALASASAEQATRPPFSSQSATTSISTSSSSSQGVSMITGDIVLETPATQTRKTTAVFAGRPLMTGSCNVPYFAIATGAAGMATQYPLVGCSDGRQDCCPFDPETNAVLTQCPQDHFTTAGACCPM